LVWRPFAWQKSSVALVSFRRAHWLRVIARLAPGGRLLYATCSLLQDENARQVDAFAAILAAFVVGVQIVIGHAFAAEVVVLGFDLAWNGDG